MIARSVPPRPARSSSAAASPAIGLAIRRATDDDETPITAAPGICFSEIYYAVSRNNAFISEGAAYRQGQNRWDNGYNVEFYAGYPQKIAGWGQATSSTTTGIPTVHHHVARQ